MPKSLAMIIENYKNGNECKSRNHINQMKGNTFPTTIVAETHKLDDWSNKTCEMAFKSTTSSMQ